MIPLAIGIPPSKVVVSLRVGGFKFGNEKLLNLRWIQEERKELRAVN